MTTKKYASGVYPGESDDKRAARVWVYRQAANAPRAGAAVALAGPEPWAEVALLRDYLCWPGERTWIVDWAKKAETRQGILDALACVAAQWPTANVARENICDVVQRLPGIGFANLDFMGQLNRDSMQPCIRSTVGRLLPGGVMSVTWFRGRERFVKEHSSWDILAASKRSARSASRASINDVRWSGVLQLVDEWADEANVRLSPIGAIEYQHRHSPMSVTVWQRQA